MMEKLVITDSEVLYKHRLTYFFSGDTFMLHLQKCAGFVSACQSVKSHTAIVIFQLPCIALSVTQSHSAVIPENLEIQSNTTQTLKEFDNGYVKWC